MSKAFVTIGDIRIKKSNIKSFGIAKKTTTPPGGLLGGAIWWAKTGSFVEGVKAGTSGLEKRVLHVTTYQNDNYTFTEGKVDIDAALRMLENM